MMRESPGKKKCFKIICLSRTTGYQQHERILLTSTASPMITNRSPTKNTCRDISGTTAHITGPATLTSKEHTTGLKTDLSVRYFDS